MHCFVLENLYPLERRYCIDYEELLSDEDGAYQATFLQRGAIIDVVLPHSIELNATELHWHSFCHLRTKADQHGVVLYHENAYLYTPEPS